MSLKRLDHKGLSLKLLKTARKSHFILSISDDPQAAKARKLDGESSQEQQTNIEVPEKIVSSENLEQNSWNFTFHLILFQENILQLPFEMIAEILSYVPGHHSVSLTCKTFHKISCDTKFLKLAFRTNFLSKESYIRFLDNDDTFSSMMESNRRFNRLQLWNYRKYYSEISGLRLERFGQILQRFGKDIKEAHIKAIKFPPNIVDLLNFMPKLEKIELNLIHRHKNSTFKKGELKLHKLKKFESCECGHEILQIFNQLPPGVLHEISLTDFRNPNFIQNKAEVSNVIPKLFINQHNIKKADISLKCTEFLDWSQTKLKSLHIVDNNQLGSKELLERVLVGQDEMEQLLCYCIDTSMLKPIIKELKSLVELQIGTRNPCAEEIPELSKLSKLKILKIYFDYENPPNINISFLNLTKHSSVEKLEVYCEHDLPEFTISQLNVNFPNVKELSLKSFSSINAVNKILQIFPNLESLHFCPNEFDDEAYIYQEGLQHRKLKKLHIGLWKGRIKNDFAKLIGSCTKLDDFFAMSGLTKGSLKEIFTRQPNLKSFKTFSWFSIRKKGRIFPLISQADIAAVKENGKKLEKFECNRCVLDDGISPEKLQEEFKDRFDTVEVHFNSYWYSWEMEKTSKQP
jgi:hypothetical protein